MKPTIHIDASALRDSACLLKFYRIVHSGHRSRIVANDIIYGNAVHRYIEKMFKTGSQMEAISVLKETWLEPHSVKEKKKHLTEQHSFIVASMFWDWMQGEGFKIMKAPNGMVLAEHKFSLPYRETDNAIYMLSGTIDILAEVKNGVTFIADIKTTSTWDADRFMEGFQLDIQLKLYTLAITIAARYKPDSFYAEMVNRGFRAQIFGCFLKPAPMDCVFKRSRLFQFKEEDLAETQACVDMTIERLDYYVGKGQEPMREGSVNGACKTPYGSCSYFNVCSSPDSVTSRVLLERSFIQKPYDPTKFR